MKPASALRLGWRRLPGAERLWRERWWLVAAGALLTLCRLPNVDGWDDAFYIGQLTSVVGDLDLRLQDDVVLVPKRFEDKCRALVAVLPSGALANTFSLGPALLLSPATAPIVHARSPPPWFAFRAAVALEAMIILLVTALTATAVARRLGATGDTAPLAVGVALLSSPVAVYGTRSYLGAIALGAMLVAITMHQALAWVASGRARHALGLGLVAGLACVNRWQDAVVAIPVLLAAWLARAAEDRAWPRGAALTLAAAGLAGACQLLAFWIQFGTPLLVPQGADYMRWWAPQLLALVASTYHGLIPWAPGLALGLLALGLGTARVDGPSEPSPAEDRWLYRALAVGAALAIYVSACPVDWWGRDSYGPRRLGSLAPVAGVGLALLFRRIPARTAWLLAGLLGLWAAVTISAHFSGYDDLLALLTGRVDPFRPIGAPAADRGWIDRWGALHALKPGFSFADAPRAPDRVVGLAAVAVVVGLLRLTVSIAARSPRAGRLLLGLALLHVCGWLAALSLVVPSNRDWNATWAAFLAAPLDPARSAALPADTALARDVVIAAHAAAAGEQAAQTEALQRLARQGVIATSAEARRCGSTNGK